MRYLFGLFLLVIGTCVQAQDFSALRAPGALAVMRHALAPGTGDPANFRLEDCSTQRNLDQRGRDQAMRTGDALRAAGVTFDRVWTSQWCRSRDTAMLMDLGEVTEIPALNSFFENRGRAEVQTQDLRQQLSDLPPEESVMMVSHQVNISALAGRPTRSGEIVVLQRDGQGGFRVVDTVLIDP